MIARTLMRLSIAVMTVTMLSTSPSWAKLKVVASFSILGDMVTEIAGDKAEVTTIVGPDADAHLYMPTTSDAVAVAKADVIFTNGMGFETWAQQLIDTSGTAAAIVVATDGITPLMVEGAVDPHAWNSLPNGMIYARNITAGLTAARPEDGDYFAARAKAYQDKMQALHDDALAKIAALPADNRVVVTAHDAFGYMAAAYGLNFLAPVGIDTEAEPSAKELSALIDYLNEIGAGALFVENITNADLINQIARETGITIGGRIYSDALSVSGSPATSYLAMFRHNLTLLTTTLSGGKTGGKTGGKAGGKTGAE